MTRAWSVAWVTTRERYFEIEYPGVESSIGGGGRYDEMVGRWAGTDTPAAGISLGIERIIEIAELDANNAEIDLSCLNWGGLRRAALKPARGANRRGLQP